MVSPFLVDIADPNPSEIVSDFGPANQNTSSSPFERLRLRFVRKLYASVGILRLPHLYLKTLGLVPKSSLSESQLPREHPLLHLLCVLGGVDDERFCWRAKHFIETSSFQVHDFENEEAVDGG